MARRQTSVRSGGRFGVGAVGLGVDCAVTGRVQHTAATPSEPAADQPLINQLAPVVFDILTLQPGTLIGTSLMPSSPFISLPVQNPPASRSCYLHIVYFCHVVSHLSLLIAHNTLVKSTSLQQSTRPVVTTQSLITLAPE